ncbi:MAG: diphthine synthase [Thermoplasmatota archaeon]
MKRLSMIGLGIANERSISLGGLERLRESEMAFAEFYTSILEEGSIERLGKLAGKKILILSRKEVEEEERVLKAFDDHGLVCFLTAGDPLSATTHQELRFDVMDRGIEVEVINSASILNSAPGFAGLQHYKFGRTTTIAYPEGFFFPTSPLDVIIENLRRGLHTLVLLDIRSEEDRFMSASEGSALILRMSELNQSGEIGPGTMAAAVIRAGRSDWKVVYAPLGEIPYMDLGGPPHCLIVPGALHFAEKEALERFRPPGK